MRLAIVGASGRMGRAVVRVAREAGVEIACAVGTTDVGRDAGELAGIGAIGICVVDALAAVEHARASVIVDFSVPNATLDLASISVGAGIPLVSGTTGLGAKVREALAHASKQVAVLWEPNMSVGAHVLGRLVSQAAAALADYDVEIVEVHHRGKMDAPSGTALRLVDTVRSVRGAATQVTHGRHGSCGPRVPAEIGLHALRGGDVVGDHVVYLIGDGERVELAHKATSRDVFAHGALRAASWIAARGAGLYTLDDVLDIRK